MTVDQPSWQADERTDGSDGEINEQVVPADVWARLVSEWRNAHAADFHRGRLLELFDAYANGVADAMTLDRNDLKQRVSEVTR